MQQSRAMEVSTGLFVLLGFAALLFLATQITNRDVGANGKSYEVTARYENIGGLKVGRRISTRTKPISISSGNPSHDSTPI